MKQIKDAPIGVFDSGVGGLTVAREIMRNLPYEKIVYFGDTARVPYGSKSKETIIRYSRQIVRFLKTQEVKAIVVACNTASALALETISKETDLPMIGVVEPGAKVAVETTRNKKIGLIEDEITLEVAKRYLDPLLAQDIDTLILGCTHYPLLRSLLKGLVGDQVTLVNPAYETALALGRMLEDKGILREGKEEEFPYRFFVSDEEEHFQQFANSILPYDVKTTEQIRIEEY